MTTTAFDTLAYAKRLREAGVPEPQAEAQAAALADALRQSGSELATKQDVQELRLEIRHEMAELKSDLLKWAIGLFIAQVGLFAALVKLLH
ncbi:MAG: DUF1640 domain-containing protein [Candidatus Competibacteraceae bacterium]